MKSLLERPKGTINLTYYKGEKVSGTNVIQNAVVNNAKKLIARALGGDPDYLIDMVEVWLGVTVLASSAVVVSYESLDTVRFNSVFREDDFSGNFDKLVLRNSINGQFSVVVGINESKSGDEKMAIAWDIKPQ